MTDRTEFNVGVPFIGNVNVGVGSMDRTFNQVTIPAGLKPNYKLVSIVDGVETVFAFDAQRYPVVTAARKALKLGFQYGEEPGQVHILKLNKDREYSWDDDGYQRTFDRPETKKSTKAKVVDADVRIPNAQLQRELRAHAQLSVALAGMEKAEGLENAPDAVIGYLETTIAMLSQLPGIDRSTISRLVNHHFPKGEHVPAN